MCRNRERQVRSVLDHAAARLRAAGIENARREAEWLVMHATGLSRLQVLTAPERVVSDEALSALQSLMERRTGREPLQYIVGEAAFYGRLFRVDPSVLIPRPETEELVERVLQLPEAELTGGVLDLGTGSGCIPITIALERPTIPCAGVDISPEALETARQNARQLGADVTWLQADMTDDSLCDAVRGPVSVLVSNPPYVPDEERDEMQPEVRDHEPHQALFSGPDPLHFYRIIARQASHVLREGGHLLVEIHADGGAAVCRIFEDAGLEDVVLHADLAGKDRIVAARRP